MNHDKFVVSKLYLSIFKKIFSTFFACSTSKSVRFKTLLHENNIGIKFYFYGFDVHSENEGYRLQLSYSWYGGPNNDNPYFNIETTSLQGIFPGKEAILTTKQYNDVYNLVGILNRVTDQVIKEHKPKGLLALINRIHNYFKQDLFTKLKYYNITY